MASSSLLMALPAQRMRWGRPDSAMASRARCSRRCSSAAVSRRVVAATAPEEEAEVVDYAQTPLQKAVKAADDAVRSTQLQIGSLFGASKKQPLPRTKSSPPGPSQPGGLLSLFGGGGASSTPWPTLSPEEELKLLRESVKVRFKAVPIIPFCSYSSASVRVVVLHLEALGWRGNPVPNIPFALLQRRTAL